MGGCRCVRQRLQESACSVAANPGPNGGQLQLHQQLQRARDLAGIRAAARAAAGGVRAGWLAHRRRPGSAPGTAQRQCAKRSTKAQRAFSGNWCGPYTLLLRVMIAGRP